MDAGAVAKQARIAILAGETVAPPRAVVRKPFRGDPPRRPPCAEGGGTSASAVDCRAPNGEGGFDRGDAMQHVAWIQRGTAMKIFSGLRLGLLALVALVSVMSVANAADGTIRLRIFKAGFVIGGSGGDGVLTFQGRRYPLAIGGLSYGFTFGASETRLRGTVSNIRRPSDVSGVYAQGAAGAALLKGAQVVVLTNQKGAVLQLGGEQTGLIVSLDLSGLALSLK
jgi:hypothetical protein